MGVNGNQEQRTAGTSKKPAKCPVCSRLIRGRVAYFSFGAVVDLSVFEEKGLSYDELEGFCSVGYHGADPNMTDSANYSVADAVKGGQLDISFCSLACVTNWFCGIIDQLEGELATQKGDESKRDQPPAEGPE